MKKRFSFNQSHLMPLRRDVRCQRWYRQLTSVCVQLRQGLENGTYCFSKTAVGSHSCCPTADVLCVWCSLSMFSSRISPYMSSRDVAPPSLSVHVSFRGARSHFSVLFSGSVILLSFLSSVSIACCLVAWSKSDLCTLGRGLLPRSTKARCICR